jgi:integrase/recombinase XerD
MRIRNYSERTIAGRTPVMGAFCDWCEARGLERPVEVTKPILERYQRHLYLHRKKNGKPLSFASQKALLIPVKAFFKWLTKQNVILSNPASELELPRPERRLPRYVLTDAEVERVLAQIDTSEPLGIRDRAIVETLYSTGMRRMEVVALALYDVDAERGTVLIRQGKGRKDRIVPIGGRALAWIARYVEEVRPTVSTGASEATLFLTHLGEPLEAAYLTHRVRELVNAAELGKRGACHLFRHTMATVMLEGGADVRFVQEMLGHSKLETTEIYTHVSIRKLKEIHAATHPSARLEGGASGPGRERGEGREQLLFSLDAEAREEGEEG